MFQLGPAYEPPRGKTNNVVSNINRPVQSQKELESCNFGFKWKRNCTVQVAKTKAFVFAYADCGFSHVAAHILPRS